MLFEALNTSVQSSPELVDLKSLFFAARYITPSTFGEYLINLIKLKSLLFSGSVDVNSEKDFPSLEERKTPLPEIPCNSSPVAAKIVLGLKGF